jgi:hypothetical protein
MGRLKVSMVKWKSNCSICDFRIVDSLFCSHTDLEERECNGATTDLQESQRLGLCRILCSGGSFFLWHNILCTFDLPMTPQIQSFYAKNSFQKLPVWFQAIKGVSAIKSGIMNLPLVVSVVLFTIVSGGGTTAIGYYGPFMLLSTILASIGAGLLTTFEVTTAHPAWIGFQVLYGAGVGLGMQLTFTIVQAAISVADIPMATALMMFSQTLGGALFVSVAQNVFSNLLTQNLMQVAPNLSPSQVASTGATDLKNVISKEFLPGVLVAYNHALTRTWFVSVATAAVSIIGVVAIDWRISVKKKPTDVVAA